MRDPLEIADALMAFGTGRTGPSDADLSEAVSIVLSDRASEGAAQVLGAVLELTIERLGFAPGAGGEEHVCALVRGLPRSSLEGSHRPARWDVLWRLFDAAAMRHCWSAPDPVRRMLAAASAACRSHGSSPQGPRGAAARHVGRPLLSTSFRSNEPEQRRGIARFRSPISTRRPGEAQP